MCSLDSLLFSFACFRTSWKWYHSACHLLQFDFVTHYVFEFYLSCLCHCSSFIICCCSVAKSYATLRDPMNCSMPGFSVHHYLPEFAQTQAHSVNDAIQPSHLLSPPPFPLTLNFFQHQGLFQFINSYIIFHCKIHPELFTNPPVDRFCSSFKILFAITN